MKIFKLRSFGIGKLQWERKVMPTSIKIQKGSDP